MATGQAAELAARAVDQARLWQRHMAMAEIGAIAGHGVSRQALSAEDIQARALLLELGPGARLAGLGRRRRQPVHPPARARG